MRVALFFIAGLLIPQAAQAQSDQYKTSFDCGAATAVVDKAICGNETLASLDRLMAAWYRVPRNNVGDGGVLKRQRSWLRSRNRACLPKRKVSGDNYDFRYCLQKQYERRIVSMARRARGGRNNTVSGWYEYKHGTNFGGAFVAERPDGAINIAIETVSGPTQHLCNVTMKGVRLHDGGGAWRSPDEKACTVSLRFTPSSLDVKHNSCSYYCGARGYFGLRYPRTKD